MPPYPSAPPSSASSRPWRRRSGWRSTRSICATLDFAADSSGFTTSRFVRWFDHKYGTVRQQHEWVKVHLMCGVRTNIVTAVEIRDKDASDTKLLPDMAGTTAE